MSSLFDIPAQLVLVLSLAAASADGAPPAPPASTVTQPATVSVEQREGPLLYSERSWLHALHDNPHAARELGARVFVTSGGRYYLPTPRDRNRILAARNDLALATPVARAAAERNAARLRGTFHRTPVAGDLYIAHVFGAETAIHLVKAVEEEPDAPLSSRFPAIAAALPADPVTSAAVITIEEFYLRIAGAFDAPPRLVAIGLKPAVAKRGKDRRSMDQKRPQDLVAAWRAEVDPASPEPATQ